MEYSKKKTDLIKMRNPERMIPVLKAKNLELMAEEQREVGTQHQKHWFTHLRCKTCQHEWWTTWNSIVCGNHGQGTGCPACGNRSRSEKLSLPQETLESVLKSMNLLFISRENKGRKLRLTLECGECGYRFDSTYTRLIGSTTYPGRGCPQCFKLPGDEIKLRLLIETITGLTWPSKKPEWLVNEAGTRLQLDCHNSTYGSIELDGPHHFGVTFRHDEEAVKQVQQNDSIKNKLCSERKHPLLRVRWSLYNWGNYETLVSQLRPILIEFCSSNGIPLVQDHQTIDIPFGNLNQDLFKALKDYCVSQGWECLSPRWLGRDHHYKLTCHSKLCEGKGITWEAVGKVLSANRPSRGTNCPECSIRARPEIAAATADRLRGIPATAERLAAQAEGIAKWVEIKRSAPAFIDGFEQLKAAVMERGGEPLVTFDEYKITAPDLLVKCSAGHEFKVTRKSLIILKHWCLECSKASHGLRRRTPWDDFLKGCTGLNLSSKISKEAYEAPIETGDVPLEFVCLKCNEPFSMKRRLFFEMLGRFNRGKKANPYGCEACARSAAQYARHNNG